MTRIFSVILTLVVCASSALGQEPQPNAKAKAQYDSGQAALKRLDAKGAQDAFRRAIETDPSYYDAHEAFIAATRRVYEKADTTYDWGDSLEMHRRRIADSIADDELKREYTDWAAKHSKVAAYEWALGDLAGESPDAEGHYLKAVHLDPKLARAYEWLSYISEFKGNDSAATEYMKKASEAAPESAGYAFDYAYDLRATDTARYRELSLDVAKRFPASGRAAQSLYWLAENTPGDEAKIAIYHQLREQFPPAKFDWSADGMSNLFDVYARVAPDSALALAQSMLHDATDASDQRDWASRVVFAQNLVMAHQLLADHKAEAALAVLSATQVPKYSGADEMFALLKAEAADAASKTQAAYDSLLTRFAKTPDDSVEVALTRYGTKLGKSAAGIDSAVWRLRDSGAKAATPFRLASYKGAGDSVSLADYKGKVVLLTFWFPGCGPCRGEFPHFQNVVNEFRGRNFAYVGINVAPDQDPYVLPFMHGTGYTFTPLRGSDEFAKQAYHVRGEPTNFLIDGQGRIVFHDFSTRNAASERSLTMMIESMLARRSGNAAM